MAGLNRPCPSLTLERLAPPSRKSWQHCGGTCGGRGTGKLIPVAGTWEGWPDAICAVLSSPAPHLMGESQRRPELSIRPTPPRVVSWPTPTSSLPPESSPSGSEKLEEGYGAGDWAHTQGTCLSSGLKLHSSSFFFFFCLFVFLLSFLYHLG